MANGMFRRSLVVAVVTALVVSTVTVQIYLNTVFRSREYEKSAIDDKPHPTDFKSANDGEFQQVPLEAVASAGNETLGFSSIQYINVEFRHDYDDTIAIQSLLSGLRVERFEGVNKDKLNSPQGLPPSSRQQRLKKGIEACYRSHGNLWRKMLLSDWETMLVVESDATWDINIRKMMPAYAQALDQLINDKTNTSSSISPASANLETRKIGPGSQAAIPRPTLQDPYNFRQWDLLMFGNCFEGLENKDNHILYNDTYAPSSESGFERKIRQSGAPTCTTAYAITRRAALKLLLTSAMDYREPVDIELSEMVTAGKLLSYTVEPPMVWQWEYASGIGSESSNSVIEEVQDSERSSDSFIDAWAQVYKRRNVWTLKMARDPRSLFQNWALDLAAPIVFGSNSSEFSWTDTTAVDKL